MQDAAVVPCHRLLKLDDRGCEYVPPSTSAKPISANWCLSTAWNSPQIYIVRLGLFFFWLPFAARGILVPRPGIEPMPPRPALGARSLNHWTAREVPKLGLFLVSS